MSAPQPLQQSDSRKRHATSAPGSTGDRNLAKKEGEPKKEEKESLPLGPVADPVQQQILSALADLQAAQKRAEDNAAAAQQRAQAQLADIASAQQRTEADRAAAQQRVEAHMTDVAAAQQRVEGELASQAQALTDQARIMDRYQQTTNAQIATLTDTTQALRADVQTVIAAQQTATAHLTTLGTTIADIKAAQATTTAQLTSASASANAGKTDAALAQLKSDAAALLRITAETQTTLTDVQKQIAALQAGQAHPPAPAAAANTPWDTANLLQFRPVALDHRMSSLQAELEAARARVELAEARAKALEQQVLAATLARPQSAPARPRAANRAGSVAGQRGAASLELENVAPSFRQAINQTRGGLPLTLDNALSNFKAQMASLDSHPHLTLRDLLDGPPRTLQQILNDAEADLAATEDRMRLQGDHIEASGAPSHTIRAPPQLRPQGLMPSAPNAAPRSISEPQVAVPPPPSGAAPARISDSSKEQRGQKEKPSKQPDTNKDTTAGGASLSSAPSQPAEVMGQLRADTRGPMETETNERTTE